MWCFALSSFAHPPFIFFFYLVGHAQQSETNIINVGGGSQWECGICHKIFGTKVDSVNHSIVAHRTAQLQIPIAKCHVCFRNLRTEPSLKEHLKLCHGITHIVQVEKK